MTDHEQGHDEHVEDLDVPDSESDEVKGGLLPASKQVGSKMGQKFQKHFFEQKIDPGVSRFGDGSV